MEEPSKRRAALCEPRGGTWYTRPFTVTVAGAVEDGEEEEGEEEAGDDDDDQHRRRKKRG